MIPVDSTTAMRTLLVVCSVTLAALLSDCGRSSDSSGSSGDTAPLRVTVAEQSCTDLSRAQRAWLPADWKPFEAFTRTCAVHTTGGQPAVLLISVWADRYYAGKPGTPEVTPLPKPMLFAPDGRSLGLLPSNFPDDPPRALKVTFTRWINDFPHRIELFLSDPAALGDRALPPLDWDERRAMFVVLDQGA